MAMGDGDGDGDVVRELQRRGAALWTALSRLPPCALTADCRARLLKAVQAECRFVDRLAGRGGSGVADAHLSSSNFGHLEGILYVLQNQSWRVAGATAALKSFQACSLSESEKEKEGGVGDGKDDVSPVSSFARDVNDAVGSVAHVDLVCTLLGEAVWVVVINSSAQNRLWFDKKKRKGIHTRLASLLHVASLGSVVQPSAIVLLVRDGFDSRIEQHLREEFQASKMSESGLGPRLEEELLSTSNCDVEEVEDGEWVNIHISSSEIRHWTSYWIRVQPETQIRDTKCIENLESKHVLAAGNFQGENSEDASFIIGSSSCWAAIAMLQAKHEEFDKLQHERKILNMDTTALVAIVSELTNGGAQQLLNMSSEEREKRFPGMAKFVYEQALVELDEPFMPQFERILSDKLPVICEYVYDEFTSIILTNGGPREKQRAQILLSQLKVLPNLSSSRVDALPVTGKIKPRHKLVFGSGDFLQAPTVTANMSFVRAVQQQGMALAIIQHQPCALTGD
ncbi:hypothetical protein KC19_10G078300 [Ceratodon purpureus]|uniref:DUF1308 domain-containing protein n=1 Tax=Ceratodon purpureus TaxID=3225 RepID=A0A8T0GLJ9_CERPU|nr:hypothetical protein KC19_10G078300 [Ceratodon purpureus]